MWDILPWSNDDASDWFLETIQSSGLRDIVISTLQLSVDDENVSKIRAAVSILIMLGRPYTWQVNTLEIDIELAIKSSIYLHDWHTEQLSDPRLISAISSEIAILKTRLPHEKRVDLIPSDRDYFSTWASE